MSADDFSEEIAEPCPEGSGVTIDDFVMIKPTHTYIFIPCREPWVASSINALLPPMPVLGKNGKPMRRNGKTVTIRASTWIDQNHGYEQMIWAPGFPQRIEDRLLVDGGWHERKGVVGFNLYQPPRIKLGDASKAGPWLDHAYKIYPEDAEHIILWCAHRVQRPGDKLNHALVLGGAQGVGKDTLLEPLKYAAGHRNFHDIGPTDLLERFNEYAKSVVLRISEARDLGEGNRFAFYDHIKRYTVTPPGELRINEKHLRPYYIINCVSIIITTNHKTDGIYLPAGDRRHYVAWSSCKIEAFSPNYFSDLHRWYHASGFAHVAAYLTELDLTNFDPKAPPLKTAAFWEIVNVNTAPEDAELMDVIDELGCPDTLILVQLVEKAPGETAEWLMDRKNRRAIPHRLARCHYVPVRNPDDCNDGQWRIKGKRQTVYGKDSLSADARLAAARELQEKENGK